MDETLDSLPIGDLQLYQARDGYRYSLDPVLLAHFVQKKRWQQLVDLGTGSAVLLLLLARLVEVEQLCGIERQPSLARRAARNVILNGCDNNAQIVTGDIRQVEQLLPVACADLVVSNPPFRPAGTGRLAAGDERAAARHELAGGLTDFVVAARWLLRQGGSFYVVYLAERLPALLSAMQAAGIEPKRLRLVHSHAQESARLVLLEGVRGGRPGLQVEPPLIIYRETNGEGRGEYTEDVLRMYQ